jgi:hypothetical protein
MVRQYEVRDGFCLGYGYGDVSTGQVVEIEEHVAQSNVSIGRLVAVEAPASAAPAATEEPFDANKAQRVPGLRAKKEKA